MVMPPCAVEISLEVCYLDAAAVGGGINIIVLVVEAHRLVPRPYFNRSDPLRSCDYLKAVWS